MTTTTDPSTSGQLSTFGWDTVFAVRIPYVNQSIANSGVTPRTFTYTNPTDDQQYCTGTFEPWQVVRGGSGGTIHVLLPFTDLEGQMIDGDSYLPYTEASGSVTLAIHLEYTQVDGKYHLVVKPDSDSASEPVVSLVTADFSVPPDPSTAVYAIEAALVDWAMENLADFAYVFSIVDLNEEGDTGDFAFIKPQDVSYAYVDGDSDENSLLGVLALTGSTDSSSLQRTLDANAVAEGQQAGFVVSQDLLLQRLMLPNLLGLWTDASEDDFEFTPNGFQLKDGHTFTLPDVENEGTSYTTTMEEFTLTLEASEITVYSHTSTHIMAGVDAWAKKTTRYTLTEGTNSNGDATIIYQVTDDPPADQGTDLGPGVKIVAAVAAVIVAVIALVLTLVTEGAAVPVIAIVGALVVGAIMVSPDVIELVTQNDAPSLDLLQQNIYDPMVWTDSQDFAVQSVSLDGSLLMAGSLGYSS